MSVQQVEETSRKATTLYVKVVDTAAADRPSVNVRLPISMVKFGMKIGQAFSPELRDAKVDWDAVVAAIEQGELGKIVEIEEPAENRKVEVWVE